MASISIQVCMPDPQGPNTSEKHLPLSIEDQVKDAIDCIDSGYKSDVEWLMINKLYSELEKKKPTPRVKNLMSMIEPVLAKYGYHKVTV